MATKRRIILIAILVAVLSALAWVVLRPSEPVYEGKRLSFWLLQYNRTDPPELHEKAEKAIRQIGTNGIPILLRMLQAKDSVLTKRLIGLFEKQRLLGNPFTSAEERNYFAADGFEILGADAKGAVPALIEIYRRDMSEYALAEVDRALGAIGPDARPAIPVLIRRAANANDPPGGMAVFALGQIHREPEVVVPVLLQCMSNTNRFVSVAGIRAIGYFGPDARMALPVLLEHATNAASRLRFEAMRVLGRLRAEPEVMVPVLIHCLGESNRIARNTAAYALESYGPEAKAALPTLCAMVGDSDDSVRSSSLYAVAGIAPQSEDAALALGRGLQDGVRSVRLTAADCLTNIGNSSLQAAVPYLLKSLREKDEDEDIRALSRIALLKIDPDAAAKAGVK